jgi:hypothetical protein
VFALKLCVHTPNLHIRATCTARDQRHGLSAGEARRPDAVGDLTAGLQAVQIRACVFDRRRVC